MLTEQFTNAKIVQLANPMLVGDTTATVTDGSIFPATGYFRILIEAEILQVSARAGNVLTVVRGTEGTVAAGHLAGVDVVALLTQGAFAQLIKDLTADQQWATQAVWRVNPATGDNRNPGTIAQPIQTVSEWFKRLKNNPVSIPSMAVTVVGTPLGSDNLAGEIDASNSAQISIAFTPTVARSSNITTVTQRNRGTQTRQRVSDGGVVAWEVGSQLLDTAAGAGGALMWIDFDLGGGVAKVSEPFVPNAPPTINTPVHQAIANGQAYQVLTLPNITAGRTRFRSLDGTACAFNVFRGRLVPVTDGRVEFKGDREGTMALVECAVAGQFDAAFGTAGGDRLINCRIENGCDLRCDRELFIVGGSFNADGSHASVFHDGVFVDGDALLNGITYAIGSPFFANVSFAGPLIMQGAARMGTPVFFADAQVWTDGVLLFLFEIGPNSAIIYQPPLATTFQTRDDAQIGMGGTNINIGYAIDPATNLIVGPRTTTIGNLKAALGAGGLNGKTFEPYSGARFAPIT